MTFPEIQTKVDICFTSEAQAVMRYLGFVFCQSVFCPTALTEDAHKIWDICSLY